MNFLVSFVLTIAFLCATLATTFAPKKINQDLLNQLTHREINIYQEITIMRRNIYFSGLVLGIIIALCFLFFTSDVHYATRLFGAIAITFCVNYFYYILYPKPMYMLDILDTKQENKAWLKIYRAMQVRYHLSFVFGLCFAFFFYQLFIRSSE